MKSCLTILTLLIFLPLVWWGYNTYKDGVECQECQKNLNKYYLHLKSNPWYKSNCYILDCFCNTKLTLQKVNKFRKILVAKDKCSITFLGNDIYETGNPKYKAIYEGSADDINWERVFNNILVGVFTPEDSNSARLKYMFFERNEDTLTNTNRQFKELSKSWSRIVYSVDYEELNRSVLNQFAQTVYKDSTRFKYNTCVYHLYNRQAKTVEATMKYEDKGKGFYFEIW